MTVLVAIWISSVACAGPENNSVAPIRLDPVAMEPSEVLDEVVRAAKEGDRESVARMAATGQIVDTVMDLKWRATMESQGVCQERPDAPDEYLCGIDDRRGGRTLQLVLDADSHLIIGTYMNTD